MSTVNATTVYSGFLNANSTISVGNSTSNLVITGRNEQNILPSSEIFTDVNWGVVNITRTANSVNGPFGANNGTKITESTTSTSAFYLIGANSFTSNIIIRPLEPVTVSIFAKPAERTQLLLGWDGRNNQLNASAFAAYYNFANDTFFGTTITNNSFTDIKTSSTAYANGWVRLSVSGIANSSQGSGRFTIFLASGGTATYAGTIGNGLFIYGAQVETRRPAGKYVTTGISPVSNVSLSFGSNVVINSIALRVGNTTNNITLSKNSSYTTGNPASLTANSITIGGVTVNSFPTYTNVYNYQTFTSTGWALWTKPAGAGPNDLVTIMMWGGGGGGDGGVAVGSAGGGACVIVNKLAGECNAVCNVFVGAGGLSTGVTGDTALSAGQNSVFWTNSTFSITAYGGGSSDGVRGGGGGGWFGQGVVANGGGPLGGTQGLASTFGGGGGANTAGATAGVSVYGGGGGAANVTQAGGNSFFGGGGGASNGPVGVSIFGGNGGSTSLPASQPGGGGASNGPGAAGEVRVWVQKVG